MVQYTAHVKGKHYTRFPRETREGPVSYTRVNSLIHAGTLQATRTRVIACRLHARMYVCVVSQYLGVVSFIERVIVETELKFNRKLQEANVDRSKGGGKL